MKKKTMNTEDAQNQSFVDNNEDSRNSTHGYLEVGNPATIHAKGRALRNNHNGTED